MNNFADFMKTEYNKDPCDWLINHFVKKNSLQINDSPNFVFQHEGEIRSLQDSYRQKIKVKNID
jgi:3-methyladenine DNA glycosylase AlkD